METLRPVHDEYQQLLDERARILALGEIHVEPVPPGPLLKPGRGGERVVALKNRLPGPDEHSPEFDEALREAVVAFQLAAGLETDGIVGPATLEVMNASRFSWIDRIDANLERWRWLPREVPDTYVRVNIAAYTLRVIRGGEDALQMDVIVGRPYRRTPVFTETIKYVVFNPYVQPDAARRVPEIVSSGSTTTIHLRQPLPTYLVYFTAFADASGKVAFRRDIYQRDAAVIEALRNPAPS